MSIDIDLSINTGHEFVSVVNVGNYTHNCQPMWNLALKETGSTIPHLCGFNEVLAQDAFPILQAAIIHMDDPQNRATYEAMNPDNGWGEFISAREYLRTFMDACRDHPLCTIEVSC
jgi:hypothetical protein